ncbi:MAG TPA: hypothetical protein VNH44_00440 [Micropepsaceae bacterium]|nr:hypothetical protein [Micropepsaceae bacterium]
MPRREVPKRERHHTPKRPRRPSDLEIMRLGFSHMLRVAIANSGIPEEELAGAVRADKAAVLAWLREGRAPTMRPAPTPRRGGTDGAMSGGA